MLSVSVCPRNPSVEESMTSWVRSTSRRLLAVCALLLCAAPLAAQEVAGKIEGTVSDQAGVPLANAQVLIVGTSYGAVTNDRGYYFINNVPVGTYSVRAQFIGYQPTEVRGVRVQGGQTQTVDVRLQASAVEVTGVTVTAAANPIVPRDQVTSKGIVEGELINQLPVNDVRQILTLTPGVVESGSARGVSVRGGRPGEAAVYIDGAPVRSAMFGTQALDVGTNAVEEASVTTGALGVEFSDAQSGLISYTTRAGGQQLSGSLTYESDEAFSNTASVGYNRFEGSLGGPIPGVTNLTWFLSGVLQGQLSNFRGKGAEDNPVFTTGGLDQMVSTRGSDGSVTQVALPQYVQYGGSCDAADNYGYECQGWQRPMDWSNFNQLQGKLQFSYGSGSTVALTGLSNNAQDRDFPGTDIGSPAAFTGTHTWSRLFVLNWSHQAFRSAERALSVNLNVSYGWDRGMFGHLTPESDLDSRNPTMGITFTALDFDLGDMPFPTTDAIIHNVRTNAGLRVPYLGRADLDGAQPYRLNPYGLISNGWQTSGYSAFQSVMNSEDRTTGRLVVDWQANRFHRFTLGGDLKESDIGRWAGAMNEQIFMDAYKVNPLQWGAFASDRLDLGDVVLELGVRYDWYDARTIFPTTPGRIFTHPLWDVNAATDDAVYNSLLNLRADPNDATPDYLQQVFEDSKSHTAISPRLRVSFPITEQTGFRLSYSQQVQSPNFQQMAAGINNDLAFTNTNDVFARDIDFGKSILFEFGVRHAFSQDLVFDVSAYNKDKVSDMAARILPFVDPADVTDTLFVNVLTNRDFGNAKGVDFKVDWRAGSYLNTSVAYTYQISKNTGSDPFSYLNTFARQVSGLTGDRTPPPEAAQRTDDDRTHSLSAAVALQFPSDFRSGSAVGTIFRDVGVFMALRAQSGLPFTPIVNSGDGQLAPRLAFGLGGRIEEGATLNAQVMPWTSNIDLRVNKGFRIGGIDLAAFADVRNLLNQTNTIQVFAETGDVENLRTRTETIGDPVVGSREYGQLWSEAQLSGALDASTHAVTFGNCQGWVEPVNCESLKRVEQRFGNGDGVYSYDEQQNAFNQFYDSFLGTQSGRFYAAQRHIRLGFELNF
jgi:hypothetical protein